MPRPASEPTQRELQILGILWQHASLTIREVPVIAWQPLSWSLAVLLVACASAGAWAQVAHDQQPASNRHCPGADKSQLQQPIDLPIDVRLVSTPADPPQAGQPNGQAPGENSQDKADHDKKTTDKVTKGLEFLAAYPRLRGLSLEMTKTEFLAIIEREELEIQEPANDSSYSIPTGDGHVVIVMFGNNGDKCSGIQRLGGGLAVLPDRRFEGDEVTVENIQRLAGRSWDTVSLVGGKFDGAIIAGLKQATSIRSLQLYGENLSGQIARLRHVNGLVSLQLGAPLHLRDLESLGTLDQLQHLRLPQDMGLTVTGAEQIARLTNLRSLDLYFVEVDDASFTQLGSLVNLERLDLSHTRITDQGLKTIEKMPRLRELMLTRYDVPQQLTDACATSILKLPQLHTLWLSGKIGDEGLAQIVKAPMLKKLSILFTDITADGLAALADSTVENLTISTQQISNETAIEHLRKCRQLKSIWVHGQPRGDEEKWQKRLPHLSWGFQS